MVSQHSNNCSSQDSNSSRYGCNITVILVIVIVAVAVIVVGVTVIAVLVRVIVSGHSTNFWSRWSRVTTGAAAVVVVVAVHVIAVVVRVATVVVVTQVLMLRSLEQSHNWSSSSGRGSGSTCYTVAVM